MVKVSPKAEGITESVQNQIQRMHEQGLHPVEISKSLKQQHPALSDIDERAVRRYIDFTGDSKKFEKFGTGLAVKVTPTPKLLGLMEKRRDTHGPSGIAFELGIPKELAKSFLDGTLDRQKIEENKLPLVIRRKVGQLNLIIEHGRKIPERTPEMEKFIANLENERQKLLDQAGQAKKNGK